MTSQSRRRWPVIRVFVSSTFTDFVHERNALRNVFSSLEHFCLQQSFQFQAIDLRWGISKEAGFHHRTLGICFEELRRSQRLSPRPNFLILLGNHYGWRPLPEVITPDEFGELAQAATTQEDHNTLRDWYRLDSNAVPAVHILQPRTGEFQQQEKWTRVEQTLWTIINSAISPTEMRRRFSDHGQQAAAHGNATSAPPVVRFHASATEQEIWRGALSVKDADNHVLACLRTITNPNEFDAPAFIDRKAKQKDLTAPPLHDNAIAMEELRGAIQTHLASGGNADDNIHKVNAKLIQVSKEATLPATIDVDQEHIEEMCNWFERRLKSIIQRQIDEYRGPDAVSHTVELPRTQRGLEIEQEQHWWFAEQRGGNAFFVGRSKELRQIRDYLNGYQTRPLVIQGESGCGKTALLAQAAVNLGQQPNSDSQLIVRFLGTTAQSSDVRSLMESLCRELRLRSRRDGRIPRDYRELLKEWREQLQASKHRLIIMLDSLDQLAESDRGLECGWLPTDLPSNVKIIVSCLSDRQDDDPEGEPYRALLNRLSPREFIHLQNLSQGEAKELLFDRWLPQAGRRLTATQQHVVEGALERNSCRQPIYLRILIDRICRWHSYGDAPRALPATTAELIDEMLDDLQSVEKHGRILRFVLSYLASARRGLSEDEIVRILVHDRDAKCQTDDDYRRWHESLGVFHELPKGTDRVPIVLWVRMRSDLSAYLTQRAVAGGGVMAFFHRQVRERVQARFLGDDRTSMFQQYLSQFFSDQPDFLKPDTTAQSSTLTRPLANARKADELIWLQLRQHSADSLRGARDLLLTISFLEAKASAGLLPELIEEIGAVASVEDGTPLGNVQAMLQQDADFLADNPQLVFQSLWNLTPGAQNPTDLLGEYSIETLVRDWRSQLSERQFMLAFGEKERHAKSVLAWERTTRHLSITSLAVSGDGKLIVSAGGSTICVWDGEQRRLLEQIVIDQYAVNSMFLTPTANMIVAAVSDGSVRAWDWPLSGTSRVLQRHDQPCTAVACSPDGTLFCAGWKDGRVGWWHRDTVADVEALSGPAEAVNAVAFGGGDHRRRPLIAAGTDDLAVFLWDLERGLMDKDNWLGLQPRDLCFSADGGQLISATDEYVRIKSIVGSSSDTLAHNDHVVYAIATTADGVLATAAADGTVRLWRPPYNEPFGSLVVGGHRPASLSFLDPTTLLSGGRDGRICQWNLRHVGETSDDLPDTTCVGMSADGTLIVTGHLDGQLRIWDARTGTCDHTIQAATVSIRHLVVAADASVVALAIGDQVRIFRPGSDRIEQLVAAAGAIASIAISDDGRVLSLATTAGVQLWDLTSNTLRHQLSLTRDPDDRMVTSLNADGTRVGLGTDGQLTVWEVSTGKLLDDLSGFVGVVHDLAFSEDGHRVALVTPYATKTRDLNNEHGWTTTARGGPAVAIVRDSSFPLRLRYVESHCEIISNDNDAVVGGLPLIPEAISLSTGPDVRLVWIRDKKLSFYEWS